MRALLISTYDLGRQPFGLASAAAAAGGGRRRHLPGPGQAAARRSTSWRASDAVAFFLPMHTATRLALPVIDRVRARESGGAADRVRPVCAAQRGVAPRARRRVTSSAASSRTTWCRVVTGAGSQRRHAAMAATGGSAARARSWCPIAAGCRGLSRYATLQIGSERRVAGYTEASRGCKHRCRHCPIVPVYDGRFRIVPIPSRAGGHPARRSPPARGTSRSATPTSSTARARARAGRRALAREFPASPTTSPSRSSTCSRTPTCCRCCATPAACSSPAPSSRSTIDVLAQLEKGHTRARLRAGRRAAAATPA